MQGKGLSLRLGLVALVVVLVFGALGSFSLARDAFDADYDDCPAATRLGAIDGLTIDRTDEEDEIRISWDSLESAVLSNLGPNGYRARLTVIVDGEDARNVALGDTDLVIDDIDFAEDLTVSVAVTLGKHVISDIAEAEFTSGLPAPRFSTDIKVSGNVESDDKLDDGPAIDAEDGKFEDLGTFYYLGFNDLFDNWYVKSGAIQMPRSPRFRVGLQHGASGVDAGDADFENYRIVIEDSSGDLLGYQAETVSASKTYGSNKIVFSADGTPSGFLTRVEWTSTDFSNIRLSNQVTDTGDVVSPYFNRVADEERPAGWGGNLAFGNVGLVDARLNKFPAEKVLYADAPVEYFDFPSDVFEADGSYTIRAWAEDDDGTRISPQTSIKLGVQEQESVSDEASAADEDVKGGVSAYDVDGVRSFGIANKGNMLIVYGFSIQDE